MIVSKGQPTSHNNVVILILCMGYSAKNISLGSSDYLVGVMGKLQKIYLKKAYYKKTSQKCITF